ncbi:MAG: SDR family oxidoreductase, partial [Gemmatimonadaceae bacterium]
RLTNELDKYRAVHNVQVNAIAPGYFATDNTRALRDDPARFAEISARIPAGRWGDPRDLAGAVVFLASSASDYVTGHVLVVDGGWTSR